MNPYERRSAIMDILCREQHTTTARLAAEVGVTERTIRNDITTLSLHYPIQTIRGRYGGGVQLADWFKPQSNTLSSRQKNLLERIRSSLVGEDLIVLNSILIQFDLLERLL